MEGISDSTTSVRKILASLIVILVIFLVGVIIDLTALMFLLMLPLSVGASLMLSIVFYNCIMADGLL